jgi:hypothetical protein
MYFSIGGAKDDTDMVRYVTNVVITDENITLCDWAFIYLH